MSKEPLEINNLCEDVAAHIVAAGIAKEIDQDIYIHYLPTEIDNGICAYESGSTAIAPFTDTSVRYIKLRVRNISNSEAQRICTEIFDLFNIPGNILTLNNVTTLVMTRDQPNFIGLDEHGRSIWQFVMHFTYRYKNKDKRSLTTGGVEVAKENTL